MSEIKSSRQTSKSPVAEALKTRWFNPHRKRFWVIVAVIVYTLLGFFAVPVIVKNTLTSLLEENSGRTAQIKKVEFNPYVLSLRIQEFEMQDTDGVKLAAFDELFVNFQLSSLFRWAWTFREIRLNNSYFFYERFAADDSRISRLLAYAANKRPVQTEPGEPEKPVEENQGQLPRLLIYDLSLNGGIVEIKDNVPAMPVMVNLGPVNINIKKLNTLPNLVGKHIIVINLPDDARLQWEGNLSLTPLDSAGQMRLTNANMNIVTAYLQDLLPLESVQARLSSHLQYHVHLNNNGQLDVDIDDLAVELEDVAIKGLSPTTEFFALKQLALQGGKLRYPEQRVELSSLNFTEPKTVIWRKEDGLMSVNDLIPVAHNAASEAPDVEVNAAGTGGETAKSKDSPRGDSWHIDLKQLALTKGRVDFADYSIQPNAQIGINDLVVNATDISNQPGTKIPLKVTAHLTQGGELAMDALLQILPQLSFSGQTKTRDIPLAIAQPYVQQFVRLQVDQGKLNTDLTISHAANSPLIINGALQIPGLEIKDTIEHERLLGWKNLTIDKLNLDLATNKLALSPLQFEQLFGRIIIYKDKSTNLSGLVIEQNKQPVKQEVARKADKRDKDDKFDLVIGGVNVKKSGMYFSDLSLPLPFATHIEDLNGTISTIATHSTQPANIKLEGQVDDYGLARIDGDINLLEPLQRTAIRVQFRNLLMTSLSPYTVEFVGRKIAEGKLDLDLNYDITKNRLQATNKAVLSDLQLGAKVDDPDAASLPLGLAVALLKDANGVIKIDLPIEGNINDPEFRIGGIIWQAFAGVIAKAVTSPFRLLGGLIGVDSADLGKFQFLAGRADLTPPELEKVAQLKQALAQRPKLSVEISGGVDPKVDTHALKYRALRSLLIARLGDQSAELEDIDLLDERLYRPLQALFVERFPDTPLKTIRDEHTVPPADDPEARPVLDKLAYAAELRDRLQETMNISAKDLATLAQARAEAIRDAFLTDKFDASRVVIVAPKNVKSKDGQWVKFKLGLASK